jgi:6-phosphogluconolactonase
VIGPDRLAVTGLRGEVRVQPTPDAAAEDCAAWIARVSASRPANADRFTIALSGGSMARLLFPRLAGDQWWSRFEWAAWRVYFSDERACPPDDANSNYHQARVALLDRVPIAPANVHRMRADEPDLDRAAAEYSSLLAETLPLSATGAPRLDCILLGLGENGHTASLFPGTPALEVTDRWATRGRADYLPNDRITLTFPTLNAGAAVAFLVTGVSKGEALRATAAGTTPASRVNPVDGSLAWFLDSAAATAAAD